jgi:8-oxo-dGTP diphosphatase
VTADPDDAAFLTLGDWPAADPDAGPGARVVRGVHAILHDPAGRILMQLRDPEGAFAYPGTWTPFGGAVEPGETLRAALEREIAEETGLVLDPAALNPFARFVLPDRPARPRIHLYAAPAPGGPADIRLGEGSGFAFFTEAQRAALPQPPLFRAALALWRPTR